MFFSKSRLGEYQELETALVQVYLGLLKVEQVGETYDIMFGRPLQTQDIHRPIKSGSFTILGPADNQHFFCVLGVYCEIKIEFLGGCPAGRISLIPAEFMCGQPDNVEPLSFGGDETNEFTTDIATGCPAESPNSFKWELFTAKHGYGMSTEFVHAPADQRKYKICWAPEPTAAEVAIS